MGVTLLFRTEFKQVNFFEEQDIEIYKVGFSNLLQVMSTNAIIREPLFLR